MAIEYSDLAIVLMIAASCSMACLAALKSAPRRNIDDPTPIQQDCCGPVFLFNNARLIDANEEAVSLIAPLAHEMTSFDAALQMLERQFEGLSSIVERHGPLNTRLVSTTSPERSIAIVRGNGWLRLSVTGPLIALAAENPGRASHAAAAVEFDLLQSMVKQTPHLMWKTSRSGALLWANDAYVLLSRKLSSDKDDRDGSPAQEKPLFSTLDETTLGKPTTVRRAFVETSGKPARHWFDITTVETDSGYLHFANDANALVRADLERQEFVQSFARTFAELTTGLALFDKSRRLVMFNPAFFEMTRLAADFLTTRPSIDAILDRLRETKMLPEPKNFTTWRDQFAAVEAGAKSGTYCELWSLSGGLTYRVTGRPHPNGAFALLFEDITASVSLKQRFQLDIEAGQAILNALPDALAVFSSSGTLVVFNNAYAQLWQSESNSGIVHRDFTSEMKQWMNRCTPSRIWSEMRDFVHQPRQRSPWSDHAVLNDGRPVSCHAIPISGGMTLVSFKVMEKGASSFLVQGNAEPTLRIANR
jgi:PAS domain-containing protein